MNNLPFRILTASITAIAIVSVMLAYAYFIEPDRLVVKEANLSVRNWDPAHNGLKIAILSDIHGGSNSITEAKIKTVVDLANAQSPDIIVLLGDYVSQKSSAAMPLDENGLKMPMVTIANALAGLRAKYGVFAVLGNHDGWYNDRFVAEQLTRVGITVLENEVARINVNGRPLRILGLPDHMKIINWETFSNNAKAALAKSNQEGDVIALEHSPDVLPVITGNLSISPDLKLILAAHTHGGQVWLPILGTPIVPSSYGQKYSYGHVRENNVDMWVDSGIGTSILPIRFMMPPQISVLTIGPE